MQGAWQVYEEDEGGMIVFIILCYVFPAFFCSRVSIVRASSARARHAFVLSGKELLIGTEAS